ncbi:QacE family quaternary ammonium compound efflux SMR transporter [Paenibacillus sp. PK3_47]|uniref:DMT family transporter n=1 Tax=Paenibacillus sp. PK3_47 TaxID=2072642 RepID=UPI00201DDF06|nr:multidrug efflux SMR transporter [Paenibacillus sp. PK3_47]UQZ36720.1 QacE family quaternary ammonium compound efflux SMR transporter [Paenibacillus sp. PK3_47]
MNLNWLYVIIGGIVEVFWVSGLKHSTTLAEWIFTIIAIAVSFMLIIRAASKLPVGTVYAVFTGLGTAGTVASEMLLYGEPFKLGKVLLIGLLLSGVIGLKLVTDKEQKTEGRHS